MTTMALTNGNHTRRANRAGHLASALACLPVDLAFLGMLGILLGRQGAFGLVAASMAASLISAAFGALLSHVLELQEGQLTRTILARLGLAAVFLLAANVTLLTLAATSLGL